MKETFANALRAEIDAVVVRYEALVASQRETFALAAAREADALRAEIAALREGRDRGAAEIAELRAEIAALRIRADVGARAEAALTEARARIEALEREVRAGNAAASALQEQFAAEGRFVESHGALAGTLFAEAVRGALGREIEPSPAAYAALKAKGLEAVLVNAFKDRGRSISQAPLLERERTALAPLAAAAGCELVVPDAGIRFSSSSMDKAATAHDPAEEGNVVQCLLPGLRRAGTEGALVFPRVLVATG